MDNFDEILDILGELRAIAIYLPQLLIDFPLELRNVLGRDIDKLSGGELQRFAIGLVCVQKADV